MVQNYKIFLAEQVLNDDKPVTYRHVARAMGVHAAEAKRMLFDFHRLENEKNAGSVHATYILSGFQTPRLASQSSSQAAETNGEDVEMQSSPFPVSSMPQEAEESEEKPVKTFTLVREERLEDAKGLFVQVAGFHVYSIQSSSLKNLELLSTENERLFHDYGSEDLLVKGKTYGIIQNPNAKRRTGARPPPPTEAGSNSLDTKATTKQANPFAKSSSNTSSREVSSSKSIKPESSAGNATASRPPVSKDAPNIFKSFAKSKKPKSNDEEDIKVKPGGPTTDSSARGAHSMAISSLGGETEVKQDVQMADENEDDEGDDDIVFPKSRSANRGSSNPSKAEKDAELRKKMFEDDEDEDMPDAVAEKSPDVKEESAASPEWEESEPEPEPEPEPEQPDLKEESKAVKEEEPTEQVTVSNGRRRGRRRIIRKKMIKDAEGYLVSREEPGWESFSEEDVPPPKSRAAPAVSASSGKKGVPAKKGQGNIMSFFGKK